MDDQELYKKLNNDFLKVFPNEQLNNYVSINNVNRNAIIIYFNNNHYYIKHFGIRQSENSILSFTNYNDFLWNVLNEIIISKSINYATLNKKKGQDFRRQLFKEQVELMAKYSEEFKTKKINEIEKILENNPYNDDYNVFNQK